MPKPKIAQQGPYPVDLEKGETKAWCQCGESENQPYCDGSHKATSFKPVVFKADQSKKAYLCGCKQTKKAPYCDGTHRTLLDNNGNCK